MRSDRSSLAPGWSLDKRDPKAIEAYMPLWEWFYRFYFLVESDGWERIPSQDKVLLVGSHNGGLAAPDLVMFAFDWFRHFGTQRPIYALMHPQLWKIHPFLSRLASQMGAIQANPKMAVAALRSGASVLVYPGGAQDVFRPYSQRHQIHFAGRKGFIKLALRENVPIIPIISTGAHETLIVLGDWYEQAKQLHEWGMPWLLGLDPDVFPIYIGCPWGLAFGPLPNIPFPSSIRIRICTPIVFPRYGHQAARDRDYVDECYNSIVSQMQQDLDGLVKERNSSRS
jgi:1-acyl-sn-glycerol-3-phosphate acyltransferase